MGSRDVSIYRRILTSLRHHSSSSSCSTMNPLFLVFLAAVAQANRLPGGPPSSGYGAPPPPPPPSNGGGYSYGAPDLQAAASSFDTAAAEDPVAALAANIPGGGVPGEDYPILASVPDTGFSCEEQDFPGYYADTAPQAGCQVFHICQFDGRQDAFLCPNGTIFNQQYFVCDWWFNVDCAASEQFRSLNADIGKIPEDAEASVRTSPYAFYKIVTEDFSPTES
ncbi:uncharacterized protein LOC122258810 [Penaeus japonicus]|uniref:uncharacterized protein LOC122258810 n=1 Tax=Penaeus japonicus TaxID=27405 RepID=UPI001C70CCCB|nr:uncharacterized protein LOC122258810 [Penaeus japonicus]